MYIRINTYYSRIKSTFVSVVNNIKDGRSHIAGAVARRGKGRRSYHLGVMIQWLGGDQIIGG